jgi:hypothetical protein
MLDVNNENRINKGTIIALDIAYANRLCQARSNSWRPMLYSRR